MGKTEIKHIIPFTQKHVKDRNLIIKMLKFEDMYGRSDDIQNSYKCDLYLPRTSLTVVYKGHRKTLDEFGFDTSDESVTNYRTIFKNYYKSPSNYDEEVISSVFYMKNNKCVFYNLPKLTIGDKMKDCNLLKLDGTSTKLFDILKYHDFVDKFNHAIVGAFSNS